MKLPLIIILSLLTSNAIAQNHSIVTIHNAHAKVIDITKLCPDIIINERDIIVPILTFNCDSLSIQDVLSFKETTLIGFKKFKYKGNVVTQEALIFHEGAGHPQDAFMEAHKHQCTFINRKYKSELTDVLIKNRDKKFVTLYGLNWMNENLVFLEGDNLFLQDFTAKGLIPGRKDLFNKRYIYSEYFDDYTIKGLLERKESTGCLIDQFTDS